MFPTPSALFPPSAGNGPSLRIKVCGMRTDTNIREVANLGVDFMGFIFYAKSPRYAVPTLDPRTLDQLPPSVLKVGVFVNETTDIIQQRVVEYGLDLVQLHGHESPAQCAELRAAGTLLIKAFSVDEAFDFAQAAPYVDCCNYFLFDTKGPALETARTGEGADDDGGPGLGLVVASGGAVPLAFTALAERGVVPGRDVSVVAMLPDATAAATSPPVSNVSTESRDVSRRAVQELFRLLGDDPPSGGGVHLVPPRLTHRRTTVAGPAGS